MAYDGLVAGAMAIYLNGLLSGGRIEKIYQPDKEELILYIRTGRETRRLYISSNSGHARMHLLDLDSEHSNPKIPPAFCMLLRKHFQGGRITKIRQIKSERIIEIYVDHADELGFTEEKKLIVEIMGKHSNIIAVDVATGRISDSIKRISKDVNRYREILPGLPYVFPPDHGKACFYTLSEEELEEIMKSGGSFLQKALVDGIMGIGPAIAEEICNAAVFYTKHDTEALSAAALLEITSKMSLLIHSGDLKPVVYTDKDNKPADFHIFPLSNAERVFNKVTFNDPSSAAEYYYFHKSASNRVNQKASDLKRSLTASLSKLYLKKQRLFEDLYAASNAEPYRIFGELLTANLHNIRKGASSATVFNYYDNADIDIPLDPRLSPADNAQRYFKTYSKAKTAIREKKAQLEETDLSVEYFESVLTYVENAGTTEEIEEIRAELTEGGYLRKRSHGCRTYKSKLRPLVFTAGDGSRIFVGRNNKENDLLTLKTAAKSDLWFHARGIPGSHVILSGQKGKPSDKAMTEAASLAAYYSKARSSDNVPVDYTLVKHVKKPSGAKPGMVIYTGQKTLFVNPIKEI